MISTSTNSETQKKTPYKSKKMPTKSLLVDSDSESTEETDNDKKPLDGKVTKRLTNDTKKKPKEPALAYLSGKEIQEKLRLYTRIGSNDVIDLPLGCRIKYIEVIDTDTFKYRAGGVIIVNGAPDYLVLASNRKSWSVQLENTIVFREKFEMVREEYESTINELKKQLKNAHNSIARFNNEKHNKKKKKKDDTE